MYIDISAVKDCGAASIIHWPSALLWTHEYIRAGWSGVGSTSPLPNPESVSSLSKLKHSTQHLHLSKKQRYKSHLIKHSLLNLVLSVQVTMSDVKPPTQLLSEIKSANADSLKDVETNVGNLSGKHDMAMVSYLDKYL